MFIFIALIKYHTGVLASKAMPVKFNFLSKQNPEWKRVLSDSSSIKGRRF